MSFDVLPVPAAWQHRDARLGFEVAYFQPAGRNNVWWSGAGSNRRPSAFQGFRRPSDHDLVTIVTTQLTGIEAGQWAYRAIMATVPPCAT